MEENKESWEGIEEYLATEVIQQAKNHAKRWFIAWMVTMAALVGTNAAWLYVFQSYEYVSQDGNGQNNINTGNQEIEHGTENED